MVSKVLSINLKICQMNSFLKELEAVIVCSQSVIINKVFLLLSQSKEQQLGTAKSVSLGMYDQLSCPSFQYRHSLTDRPTVITLSSTLKYRKKLYIGNSYH